MGRPRGRPPGPHLPPDRCWVLGQRPEAIRTTYAARAHILWETGQPFFRLVAELIGRLAYRLTWEQHASTADQRALVRELQQHLTTWAFHLGQLILATYWTFPHAARENRALQVGAWFLIPGARFGYHSQELDLLDLPQRQLSAHVQRMARRPAWLTDLAGPAYRVTTPAADDAWAAPPLLVWGVLQTALTEFDGPDPAGHVRHHCEHALAERPYQAPAVTPRSPDTDLLLQFARTFADIQKQKGLTHTQAIERLREEYGWSSQRYVYAYLKEARVAAAVLDRLTAAFPESRPPAPPIAS